ncbi:DUF1275 domain-containing protein [Sphingomonas canadensis]|uniref:DUF1275 domain-containing protein n=1 Tax=Sphingomonas canadensis TaxID=1219257 RepID=A0ABW3H220_9SPHN|nr:DUF1275 domain-containing protein [Sphingomonas canadensis]MCW3835335.1 DUF1275 domain-containing protein [Sphingomonas canadensis]
MPPAAIAAGLAALAGFVDALAFLRTGGFFAATMSGNATRLGTGIGGGLAGNAALALALVLAFVSGVIVASVISRASPAWKAPAGAATVAMLLGAAALLDGGPGHGIAALAMAAAMGAGHLAARRAAAEAFGGASLTGALVELGERLEGALAGDAPRWGWTRPLLLWVAFAGGAVLGAGALAGIGPASLWLAALAAALSALWLHAGATRRPRPAAGDHPAQP